LLFVGIAAAIIGSLYGIYKLIESLVNAETEEEAALRKANEAMEEAKQAAKDTKSAYESLKNAVSNYDDAINALEKCTKGTQEWRDAF
jgi:predicted  nucleic acid-binding Zn-ribbon protein